VSRSQQRGKDLAETTNSGNDRKDERPDALPNLTDAEIQQVQERTTISAVVVHEAVREEGERELSRPVAALAWSGLAAGLSMGFSLVGQGLLQTYLPPTSWRPVLASFGYSLGFLIVVLGRQQLFTENTLTPILQLLTYRNLQTLMRVLRLWAVVLVANILGALAFAYLVAHTAIFPPAVKQTFDTMGHDAARGDFVATLLRAVFAGWLIALMVWLLPTAETARVHIIIILTYFVGLGGFAHIIAGSVEVLYSVAAGSLSWIAFLWGFFVPTLIGNCIGGVSLVAALNFAQVITEGRRNAKSAL
jgi:formate/nitrite transporter FocA (FNT family)